MTPAPLLPFWEKGLGDEGKLAKLGCTPTKAYIANPKTKAAIVTGPGENYLVDGVEFQIGHETITNWERETSSILEEFDLAPMMKAMLGILISIPLYGEPLVQQWKMQIANYPDGLAQRMVEHYLKFFAIWGMQEKLVRRDTTLWYY